MKLSSLFKIFYIFASLSILSGCSSEEPMPDETPAQTVLLYAIASNNLYSNLVDDKKEIIKAAESINSIGRNLNMLVYEVTNYGEPVISELIKNQAGEYEFKVLMTYDRSFYSTDPRRISEVINDAIILRPAKSYGLILWSHGTGIDVTDSTHPTTKSGYPSPDLPLMYSFGSDNDPGKDSTHYDQINVDDLADAIPSGLFNFIWFDACYMAGIETIYELRDKCEHFVGYPTEVFTPGMPYHLTLPYILSENPNLEKAASEFFDYYAESSSPSYRVATVAVIDMSHIEELADLCKKAYSQGYPVTSTGLQCYTRGSIGPFYDFGQYTRKVMAENPDAPSAYSFDEVMGKFVKWSASTDKDFNGRGINKKNLSVISCWIYNPALSSDKSKYYLSLDWCKRVYPSL